MGDKREREISLTPEQKPYSELGNYQKLFTAVFLKQKGSIPQERVQEVIDGVNQLINDKGTLTEREAFIIEKRHLGEKSMPLDKVGKELGISKERVRQIEAKTLRKLRYPKRLGLYRVLPDSSIARTHMGAVFAKDLPDMQYFNIDLSRLSEEASRELRHTTSATVSKNQLCTWLSKDLVKDPQESYLITRLSMEDRNQIAEQLKEYAMSIEEIKKAKEEEGLRQALELEAVERKLAEEPIANNLLPELDLSEETLKRIGKIKFDDLNLSTRITWALHRAGITKIRDLLAEDRQELPSIRQFGRTSARSVGEKIQELIAPDSTLEEHFVANLLESSMAEGKHKDKAPEIIFSSKTDAGQTQKPSEVQDAELETPKPILTEEQQNMEKAKAAKLINHAVSMGNKTVEDVKTFLWNSGIREIAGLPVEDWKTDLIIKGVYFENLLERYRKS